MQGLHQSDPANTMRIVLLFFTASVFAESTICFEIDTECSASNKQKKSDQASVSHNQELHLVTLSYHKYFSPDLDLTLNKSNEQKNNIYDRLVTKMREPRFCKAIFTIVESTKSFFTRISHKIY